MTHRRVVWQ